MRMTLRNCTVVDITQQLQLLHHQPIQNSDETHCVPSNLSKRSLRDEYHSAPEDLPSMQASKYGLSIYIT